MLASRGCGSSKPASPPTHDFEGAKQSWPFQPARDHSASDPTGPVLRQSKVFATWMAGDAVSYGQSGDMGTKDLLA